jgi:hypothetical protein
MDSNSQRHELLTDDGVAGRSLGTCVIGQVR